MDSSNAEKAISDVSHALEFAFGPNLNGWPDNPTRYFGDPARDAVMAGRASRDAEVAELTAEIERYKAKQDEHFASWADVVAELAESRARFGDSEARRAELEAVIEKVHEAIDAERYSPSWVSAPRLLATLAESPSVVLEDRDRENRAIGVEAAQDRLVNRDQFASRTLDLLDELAAEYRGDNR